MSKYSNDEKVSRYKLRKVLRYIIIVFALLTVVTAILCLFKKLTIWIPIGLYIITFILRIVFNKNDFHEKNTNK